MRFKAKFASDISLATILIQLLFTPYSSACTYNGKLIGRVLLGKSSIDKICTLVKVVDDKRVTPVGRSYNGRSKLYTLQCFF